MELLPIGPSVKKGKDRMTAEGREKYLVADRRGEVAASWQPAPLHGTYRYGTMAADSHVCLSLVEFLEDVDLLFFLGMTLDGVMCND